MQDFFDVDEVVPLGNYRWVVRGQARQTFKVGDILYVAVGRSYKTVIENNRAEGVLINPGIISSDRPLTVVSIVTYGHSIDTLYKGMTGEVILEGEGRDTLKQNVIIVKME